MSLHTTLISHLLFPAQELVKRHSTVSVRRRMEEVQWWSRDQILELQHTRLCHLLGQAATHVPYYRNLFRTLGFDPRQVQGASDLQKLPLLDKSIIRQHSDALRHDHAEGLARFNTGGSSGEPLIFYIGRERVSHDVAAKWRATRWWNVDIGDPEVVVWGSPIELGTQDRLRQVRDSLMRTELLPAFEMSPERLDEFIARIRRRRPRMLFGYPSALSLIASHAISRGQRMDDLGIRVAFVTSERLYPEQRRVIEEVFACPVANGYGGRDAGFIAHECPSGSMHITAEDVIVEIVDAGGRALPLGESGEIVVTHLATKDYPFIRYRTGDIGALGSNVCSCGRGLPLLKEIEGRSTDFVMAADGKVMHGLALIYVLRDIPGVRFFKVTQHSLDRTDVEIVPGHDLPSEAPGFIRDQFRRRLGSEVEVKVSMVDEIPPERSGKFRYVVSHVMKATSVQAAEESTIA